MYCPSHIFHHITSISKKKKEILFIHVIYCIYTHYLFIKIFKNSENMSIHTKVMNSKNNKAPTHVHII